MQLFDPQPFAGKKVCVALSGGMDSVCLLHRFHVFAEEYGITLLAAHFEHGIRGEESLADLAFCEKLCKDLSVPLLVRRAEIPRLAEEEKRGIEETARKYRYDWFSSLIEEGQADLIATAHHLNDGAETVLFRLARGTALAGMRAIEESDWLVRPLLRVAKARIEEYVKENALPYREDSTNGDERYARNKIRKTVLPALETLFQGAAEHICEFARRAAADDEYLQALAEEKIVLRQGERLVPVDLPDPLFSRACLQCIKEEGARDYTSAQLAEIARLKSLQSGRRVCLPCGGEAAKEGGYIVFYRPREAFEGEIPFSLGEFTLGSCKIAIASRESEGALRADLDGFPRGCVIRSRRAGDKITPFKGKEKSLKEFLTDKKIPARKGRRLPLIAKGSEVYAVFGVEISDKVKVKNNTRATVYLSVACGDISK